MRFRLLLTLTLTLTLGLAACAAEPTTDLCELAADHRASCTGDYVTPPLCDEAAASSAEHLLGLDCSAIAALGVESKADGAFCDWFGLGCTEDEAIFTGPSCRAASDCTDGSLCLEGRCYAGGDELQDILDRWTTSRELEGSFSHLLVDNTETRDLRNAMMDAAERSVHFTALLIEDNATGRETVARLADAARRGVDVRVVVDATTQWGFSDYGMLEELRDAGVKVLPFNPINEWAGLRWRAGTFANQRLHEKLLITDGTEAVLGGRNAGDSYFLAGKWRDTDVYLAGAGVEDVERLFAHVWGLTADWERDAGCPQQRSHGFFCPDDDDAVAVPAVERLGSARTRVVYSDPRSQETPEGYALTLHLVRTAKHSIQIANSYFVPPRRLRKHLKAAVARGVRVTVVTNSLQSTDAWWMYYASLNYYKELLGAGIEVRQYRGTETMHAKTMLVDGELALVGSYNLDPRSAASNSEAMVLIRDGEAVGELARAFERDVAFTDRATADISVADWAKAKAFRIVEPLL